MVPCSIRTRSKKCGRIDGRRGGVSLLELLLVVTMMGIFAAVAFARLGPAAGSNFSARAEARRLALDLMHAQRRAISTGQNHFLQMTSSGGGITGYTVRQRVGAGSQTIETRQFAAPLSVTSSHTDLEFTFDGSSLAAYQVTLNGPDHTWQATVVPITGAVRVTQL
jgi:type II secretory pathway pseudopilin PulG